MRETHQNTAVDERPENDLAFLAAVVESSDDAIITEDLDNNITSWNKSAERIFGYQSDEIIGQPMAIIIPPERLAEERTIIDRIHRGERVEHFETVRRRSDGSDVDISLTVSPVKNDHGEIFGVSKIARAITGQRRAGEQLRQSEALKTGILNAGLDAIVTMNHECEILEFNPAAERTFGYARKDVIGKSMPDLLIPPQIREAHSRGIKRYLSTGESRILGKRVEMPAMRSDGSEFLCELAISRVPLEGPPLFTAFIRDITARKRMEEIAQEAGERYRTLFNSMDQGFCVVEVIFDQSNHPQDYRFLEINPAFEKQTGIKDAVGKRMREIAPTHEQHWYEIYGKVALTGEPIRFVNRAEALGRWYDVYAYRVSHDENRKVAIFFTDITERKKVEQALAEVQQELEDYARNLEATVMERTASLQQTIAELEAFSFTISHDLRSPLRAMQGFAQAVMEEYGDKLDDQGREYLKRISNSAVRLDTLIREVLSFSRIGRSPPATEVIDFGNLVDEVIETYPSVQMPHAEITIERPLHSVLGSRASLVLCVSNLLANAVKFIPGGAKVKIRVWTEKHESRIRFSVEDNGIGIPEDLLTKIFEPFQRGHPHAGYEGTGMGLAIVRKAIHSMGGTVGVRSQVGQGSTFWIELPSAADADSNSNP